MTPLADIIQSIIDRTGLSREALGIALGYPPGSARQTIYKILAGGQQDLKPPKRKILVEKFDVDPAAFAAIVSLPPMTDAPIRTKRVSRSAPKMADYQHEDDTIPVFSFVVTEEGEWVKKAIGSKLRPPSLQAVRDAYAIYMPDESMRPRYRKGWLLWINPVKPVSEGRDALILLKDQLPVVRQVERAGGRLVAKALTRTRAISLTDDIDRHLVVGADQEG